MGGGFRLWGRLFLVVIPKLYQPHPSEVIQKANDKADVHFGALNRKWIWKIATHHQENDDF